MNATAPSSSPQDTLHLPWQLSLQDICTYLDINIDIYRDSDRYFPYHTRPPDYMLREGRACTDTPLIPCPTPSTVPGTQQIPSQCPTAPPLPWSHEPRPQTQAGHTHAGDVIRSQLHALWAHAVGQLELGLALADLQKAKTAIEV